MQDDTEIQVLDEIDGLMDDRLMSKASSGMGLGFTGGQDDKDFTVNEAKPKQLPADPEGVEAIEFTEDEMSLYMSQSIEAPTPELPAEGMEY